MGIRLGTMPLGLNMKSIVYSFVFTFLVCSCAVQTSEEDLNYLASSKCKILYADGENYYYLFDIDKKKDYLLGKYSSWDFLNSQINSYRFSPKGDKIFFVKNTPSFNGILVLDIRSNETTEIPLKTERFTDIDFLDDENIFFSYYSDVYLYSLGKKSITYISKVDRYGILEINLNSNKTVLAIESLNQTDKNSYNPIVDLLNLETRNVTNTIQAEFIGWLDDSNICIEDSIYKIINLKTNETINLSKKYYDSLRIFRISKIKEAEYLLAGSIDTSSNYNTTDSGVFLKIDDSLTKIFTIQEAKRILLDVFYKN